MHLRRYLVAGLLIWLPVVVTAGVFKVLLDLVDQVLYLVPEVYRPEQWVGFRIPGLGGILAAAILILTGALGANLLGRRLIVWYEALFARIPLVRSVYGGVKNFASVVLSDSGTSFKKVLLIEYPRKGLYRIALQTGDAFGEIQSVTAEDVITVFVPMTPNVTSGFLAFVPRRDAIELSMSVEDALKTIVSLGVVAPPWSDETDVAPLARSERSS